MASLGMEGPYPFTSENIDKLIPVKSPGNYALGHLNLERTFIVKYVGRSDTDLNKELKTRLNDGYQQFKFRYAKSPIEAFEKECCNFHDFGENESLDNKIHPARPNNSVWKCPKCTLFD